MIAGALRYARVFSNDQYWNSETCRIGGNSDGGTVAAVMQTYTEQREFPYTAEQGTRPGKRNFDI